MKQTIGLKNSFWIEFHYHHFPLSLMTCFLSSHPLPLLSSSSPCCSLPLPAAISSFVPDPHCCLPPRPAARFGSGSTGLSLTSLTELINLGFVPCLHTTGLSLLAGIHSMQSYYYLMQNSDV